MSSKPPQELRQELDYLVAATSKGKADADNFMRLFTAHMQAGFEYAIKQNVPHDRMQHVAMTGACSPSCPGYFNNERDDARKRAAEWLLGSKE